MTPRKPTIRAGSYCNRWGMLEGTNGLWTYLFMMSKLFEFVDTLFIVSLHKC